MQWRHIVCFIAALSVTAAYGGGGGGVSSGGGGGSAPPLAPPAISSFSATPASITAGQATTSTAVSVTSADSAPYPSGLSDATIQVAGVVREYRVHVPVDLSTAPSAIVFVLHGGGGVGLDVANTGSHPLSVFRNVADREGFVVVYPGGLPARDGRTAWNDCRADNKVTSDADDVGFLDALIDRVRTQYGLPTSRVFMAGGSNGAQMTLAYAIVRAGNVAAVAASAGNLPRNPKAGACSGVPTRRVPLLIAHGTADVPMPYEGGCVANFGGACNRGRVISAQETRDWWLNANGLSGVSPTQTVVDLDTTDAGPANRFAYAGTAPVEWWRLDGAGHTVASRTVRVSSNAERGVQNRDIEFADVAWAFFKSRLAATAAAPPSAAALRTAFSGGSNGRSVRPTPLRDSVAGIDRGLE